ncbi:MAG: hypothetical protein OXI17_06515, partial [Gammaproteobacteria bacterium]|nr:hypothetical protein [Gammaproteobacteria bacterium]
HQTEVTPSKACPPEYPQALHWASAFDIAVVQSTCVPGVGELVMTILPSARLPSDVNESATVAHPIREARTKVDNNNFFIFELPTFPLLPAGAGS